MDQTEPIYSPVHASQFFNEFEKFRLIVNEQGGSPGKRSIRLVSQSPNKKRTDTFANLVASVGGELALNSLNSAKLPQKKDLQGGKQEQHLQLEKIVDTSEANFSGDENAKA